MNSAASNPMLRRVLVSVLVMLGASAFFLSAMLLIVTAVIDLAVPDASASSGEARNAATQAEGDAKPVSSLPSRGAVPRSPAHQGES